MGGRGYRRAPETHIPRHPPAPGPHLLGHGRVRRSRPSARIRRASVSLRRLLPTRDSRSPRPAAVAVRCPSLRAGRGGLAWWLLSSLIPLATWRLAWCLVSPRAAALAALLASVDPLFITYGGFFTSEIPATALRLPRCGWVRRQHERRPTSDRAPRCIGSAWWCCGGGATAADPESCCACLCSATVARPPPRDRGVDLRVATPVAGGVAYSTAASGHLTAIADNGGLRFFVTRCPVRELRLIIPPDQSYVFGSPGRGYAKPRD